MDSQRRLVTMALAALVGNGFSGSVLAQDNGPIRIFVPYAAGSAQELVVRTFINELSAALGQSVVLEERPGAGGALASALVTKAKPDGHTLLIAAATHLIAAIIAKKPLYDPIRDVTPVAHIGVTGGHVVAVRSTFPAQNFADFVKYAKANPGKVTYSSAGVGSITHIAMAMIATAAGVTMLNVPFTSNSEPITEVMSGRIDATAIPMVLAPGFAKDTRLRMLAVTSAKRSPLFPDLPTVADTFPGYSYQGWYGLLGPAGMAKPVVDRLNGAVNKLLGEPVIRERLAKMGIEAQPMTPEEFGSFMRADYAKTKDVLKKAGISRIS